ncbi:/ / Thiamine pyrophosphokinase / 397487:398104 Forward [Candidatus Hepatoplasma crinochetorum]|uniref:Thiamine diphosphokinase n=1 Tax=Candidatus Hepatoplasma crinochetorum TaxID=295596 RepID=A0A0G7ZL77_9MOLU|nr:/ / Thiamine pyrophosphokinase / 397487:398104 Forward [Candidatus Hepatoplasma crinochetorum]
MKKCLITTKKINKIKYDNYETFIGVEYGAKFLYKKRELKNRYYISDFDSFKKFFKKKEQINNIVILPKERDFVDTEEAIKYAIKLGYKNQQIEVFVDEDLGRKDHLFNIFNLARKYQIIIFGNKFKITPISKEQKIKIYKNNYKYISLFIFEKTIIKTKSLKYDLNKKEFNLNQATNLISNEILKDSCYVEFSNKGLIIQAND